MSKEDSAVGKVRVAILDDHQSTLDGYAYRLSKYEEIELVATARYGNQLDSLLEKTDVHLLVLDVSVPISAEDSNPFPLLHRVPRILEEYPDLAILVISMHKQRTLIKAVMEAGVKGYILKDDRDAIMQLGDIISLVAAGGVYFSKQSYDVLAGEGIDTSEFRMLTRRQIEALSLCAASPDLSTVQLADRLNIAPSTLRNLLSDAYMRLKVRNRAAAIAKARQFGLITPFQPQPDSKT